MLDSALECTTKLLEGHVELTYWIEAIKQQCQKRRDTDKAKAALARTALDEMDDANLRDCKDEAKRYKHTFCASDESDKEAKDEKKCGNQICHGCHLGKQCHQNS